MRRILGIIMRGGMLLASSLVVWALSWICYTFALEGLSNRMMSFEVMPLEKYESLKRDYFKEMLWKSVGTASVLLTLAGLVLWGWISFLWDVTRSIERNDFSTLESNAPNENHEAYRRFGIMNDIDHHERWDSPILWKRKGLKFALAIFGTVAGIVTFFILSISAGLAAWNLFSAIHFFIMDAVENRREIRGYSPQPAYWRDFLPYIWIYSIPAFCSYLAFVFTCISGNMIKSLFRCFGSQSDESLD